MKKAAPWTLNEEGNRGEFDTRRTYQRQKRPIYVGMGDRKEKKSDAKKFDIIKKIV